MIGVCSTSHHCRLPEQTRIGGCVPQRSLVSRNVSARISQTSVLSTTSSFIKTTAYTSGPSTARDQCEATLGVNGTGNGASANGAANGSAGSGGLLRQDYGKFVQFFRQASPYIEGHRARLFVIVIPGEVVKDVQLLQSVMADIGLLHGLGVRLCIVLGGQPQIDAALRLAGREPVWCGGYRITDEAAMEAAIEVAGKGRTLAEQCLSKGPSVPMIRRHAKSDREMHFGPALRVVSGNYIAAKRRGIHEGMDFGYTGEVRFVMKDAIRPQLDDGNIVLLSNLGFTAAGEVLNCNTYDVGLHAAVELQAEKLLVVHLDDVKELGLPQWLSLSAAKEMLLGEGNEVQSGAAELERAPAKPGAAPASSADDPLVVNLDVWQARGTPSAVSACVVACARGVKRAHLVDARIDGGLLLELYSRDGIGTMISTDFYEGIRKARAQDLEGIEALLRPLEAAGVLVARSREELAANLADYTIIEREAKVLGCALLLPLGASSDGVSVAELGAFCVDPQFRGTGRGDSLLDWVEQDARKRGIQRLVLLTTRTADWFVQREFGLAGPAWSSELLPEARRSRINPARNSQLYVKDLEGYEGELDVEPGKRIGF